MLLLDLNFINMLYRILTFVTLLAIPGVAFARDFGLGATADAAELSSYGGSLEVAIGTVVGALLSLIGIIFFIMVVYGGIMWMTAAGNMETVKKSINTIISASIGIIVVLSAYAITSFVLDSVGPGSSVSAPSSGGDKACTSAGGTCGTPSSCTDEIGRVETGLCSGGTDNVCCIPNEPLAFDPCADSGCLDGTICVPPADGSSGPVQCLLPADAECTVDPECASGDCVMAGPDGGVCR